MTTNEKIKSLTTSVIGAKEYKALNKAYSSVNTELQKDAKYIELCKAVEQYRVAYYANDTEYQDLQKKCLRKALHAVAKCINEIKIPYEYLDEEKRLNLISSRNICNTDAKIASLFCYLDTRFVKKETRKKKEEQDKRIPLTQQEIAQLPILVKSGIISQEQANDLIENGRLKR